MTVIIDSQVAGISGDMLLAALVDIGADKNKVVDIVSKAQKYLPDSKIKKIDFNKVATRGIQATRMELELDETHNERKATEIQRCIISTLDETNLSMQGRSFAKNSIRSLIQAESKIHGEPMDSVHFHEAASIDTVVDILGTTIALEELGCFSDEIIATPIAVGGGTTKFSHGIVSNPANAILEMLKKTGLFIRGGSVQDELATPTGISLLITLNPIAKLYYPTLRVEEIGYGAGQKEFDDFANVLKIIKCDTKSNYNLETVTVLETNVDDISGEEIGNAIEKLVSAGAKDVTVVPALTKKNRTSNLISVICDPKDTHTFFNILASETKTLGVRVRNTDRFTLPRFEITIPVQIQGRTYSVRCKVVKDNKETKDFKVEYEDIKNISKELSLPYHDIAEFIRSQVKDKISKDE